MCLFYFTIKQPLVHCVYNMYILDLQSTLASLKDSSILSQRFLGLYFGQKTQIGLDWIFGFWTRACQYQIHSNFIFTFKSSFVEVKIAEY